MTSMDIDFGTAGMASARDGVHQVSQSHGLHLQLLEASRPEALPQLDAQHAGQQVRFDGCAALNERL